MTTTSIWTGFYKPGVTPYDFTDTEDMLRFRKNDDGTYTFQEPQIYHTETASIMKFDQIRAIMDNAPKGDDPTMDHYDSDYSGGSPVAKFFVWVPVKTTSMLVKHIENPDTNTFTV